MLQFTVAGSHGCIVATAGRGEGHISAVSAVAFSQRSAAFIVSGGADKLLKVRDPGTETCPLYNGAFCRVYPKTKRLLC